MKKHSAFSLVELSIVILIIGILIAGTIQGGRMIRKSRLSVAQTLTQTSPVNDIKDLALWYETSLEKSFITSEASDGSAISTWYDNNPQAINSYHATQTTATNQPKFYENVFYDAIPAVRFDGVDDFLSSADGFADDLGDATIFVVWKSSLDQTWQIIVTKGYAPTPYRLAISQNNPYLNVSTDSNNSGYSVNSTIATAVNTTNLISVRRATTKTDLWINGKIGGTLVTQQISPTYNNTEGLQIGGYPSRGYARGDFAEIILFKRALLTEERMLVENYLSKKYNITVSSDIVLAPSGCNNPNTTNPLTNGTWNSTSASSGQNVTGSCNSGYIGSPTIQCNNGSYGTVSGSCVSSYCTGKHIDSWGGAYIEIDGANDQQCIASRQFVNGGLYQGGYFKCCRGDWWKGGGEPLFSASGQSAYTYFNGSYLIEGSTNSNCNTPCPQ